MLIIRESSNGPMSRRIAPLDEVGGSGELVIDPCLERLTQANAPTREWSGMGCNGMSHPQDLDKEPDTSSIEVLPHARCTRGGLTAARLAS